jgi:hypothetical protein
MARMPSARELQFRDEDIRRENVISSSHFSGDIWNALPRFMLRPMCGRDSVLNHFELPSYQCLAELLKTLGQTGVFLSSMVIDLATKGVPGSLVLAPDMRKEVSLGMQRLKNLEVVLRSWVANEDPDAGDLTEFVSAFLDIDSLQKVVLAASDWDWNHSINIGKAMGSRSRENLNYVSLEGTPIHLSELIGLLGSMSERISLRMNGVCLLSGTWKQALDELRKKKYYEEKDDRVRVQVMRRPRGAQCDREILDSILGSIFIEDQYLYTEAERYILGLIRDNSTPYKPLRTHSP